MAIDEPYPNFLVRLDTCLHRFQIMFQLLKVGNFFCLNFILLNNRIKNQDQEVDQINLFMANFEKY